MTPTQFRQAGRLLFGPYWQSEMGKALGIGRRQVKRLGNGESKIKGTVAMQVRALLRQQAIEADALVGQMAIERE